MIGRQHERAIMDRLLSKNSAELLAILGRRRVGKTYLVRHHYKDNLAFEFTGTQHADADNQLEKFRVKLSELVKREIPKLSSWSEAFSQLKLFLSKRRKKNKPVIFFDELPWIAGRKSNFLQEFAYWWNDWANKQNIIVVICGSAASWMIEKVVNQKGGLHNRITQLINLKPFTLAEVQIYYSSRNIRLDTYQIIQTYMAIGGIPHYLDKISQGESASRIINRLLLNKEGILRTEFDNLYHALFEKAERHISIIEALATKWEGLTRNEIAQMTGLSNGGGLTKIITELKAATFITEILPYGKKKKDAIYRLVDEYSLFYMHFIKGKRAGKREVLSTQNQSYQIWQGYAFENICIKHIKAIKMALGIPAVNTETSSFRHKGTSDYPGIQIDLLIDRADRTINLCEIKFYNDTYVITKEYANKLRQRRTSFTVLSKTKKNILTTMITTYGVANNQYKLGNIDSEVGMEDLFLLDHF